MILLTRRFLAALLVFAMVFPACAESRFTSSNPEPINRTVTDAYVFRG